MIRTREFPRFLQSQFRLSFQMMSKLVDINTYYSISINYQLTEIVGLHNWFVYFEISFWFSRSQ